ncbi:MAG TPA: efflux transporter outer membrane subunit [Candidatus Acidoferrum sp.]|jgi:multidrug efflux system outer membrane protein|nr:efflux transporter outer membrane subunit [Candidatus Acidoferrum sp.]
MRAAGLLNLRCSGFARRIVSGTVSLAVLAGIMQVSGCKAGPDYHRPAPLGTNAMPTSFEGMGTNASEWKPALPSAHTPRGAWWDVFGDAELGLLENLAAANNQELAGTLARFDEARASMHIARAGLFPRAELDPSYIRQRTSINEPQNGRAAGLAPTYNTFDLSLSAGWELDLWGRVRRQVESALAGLAASAADLETTKLAIQAELATDYFALRSLDSEYNLLERTAQSYRRSLELTLNRRKGGVASDLDVSQAETVLRTTQADLPGLRLERAKLVHALARLCGQPPPGFKWEPRPVETAAVPLVPASLPSQLLERRPDIDAAEQRMAAANAQIGVAQGAFYPRVRFDGLAGFRSVDASSWFDWPSRAWAFGPSIQLPLFTGGLNRAELAFAHATYRETVASYRQTVLMAFQEVEDQLAAQQLLQSQLEAEEAALAAARRTLETANNRYKAGLVTYLEVATAQRSALTLERTVVQLRGDKLVAAVGLIRALGGGWENNSETRSATAR